MRFDSRDLPPFKNFFSKIEFDDYKARILFFVNLDIFDQTYSYKFALEHNYLHERTDFQQNDTLFILLS